ncbi:MAG TPA: ABC transporter ATP-binding protein [Candidatus Cloacimonadota bacterium]|nr:ABC transporter ATP-binding protein [Candidatus Cloacimonadota bacterium]HPT70939.1 ABC transporter ATP-binding protein [Candidatus Cloacimonadota bacterium]
MNLVEIKHLVKTYNPEGMAVHALRGIDLEIQEGEFVAIMGASGSGKTTFMNIIGCLDTATKGEYFLNGQEIGGFTMEELAQVRSERIGYVFQSFFLLPRTSAIENVMLPLLYGQKKKHHEMIEISQAALDRVGLKERSHNMPNQLSGGQQQRVAIARALVNQPILILADEPTGNLDTHTSYEIMAIFQELNKMGKTIILITHEPDIAQFAKRNVIFRDGKISRDFQVTQIKDARIELEKIPPLEDSQ